MLKFSIYFSWHFHDIPYREWQAMKWFHRKLWHIFNKVVLFKKNSHVVFILSNNNLSSFHDKKRLGQSRIYLFLEGSHYGTGTGTVSTRLVNGQSVSCPLTPNTSFWLWLILHVSKTIWQSVLLPIKEIPGQTVTRYSPFIPSEHPVLQSTGFNKKEVSEFFFK